MLTKVISYSSLCNWQYCAHYYKLCHIDKLKKHEDTVFTTFGGLVHRYIQNVLLDKMDPNKAANRFMKVWRNFCRIKKEEIKNQKIKPGVIVSGFSIPAATAIRTVKDILQKEFGNYKVIAIEERLQLPNGSEWPQEFKGFIDIVLELENGIIVIVDLKTCDSSFFFNKYRDKYKDYQLTLYKNFYAIKYNLNPDKIETYFMTLERNFKSKKPLSLFRVTSGPKKIKNALDWLSNGLSSINKGIWVKNRMSCLKYGEKYPCEFYKSQYCK